MKEEDLGEHVSVKGVLSIMTLEAWQPGQSLTTEAEPNDSERIGEVLLAGKPIKTHQVLMADI